MYSDPAALKHYGEFSGMPETVVRRVRELVPKDSLATDSIVGIDQIMAESVQNKFLAAPLTKEQIADLVRASELK
jgi:NitT/TauT family transport system substrate-binding protein